MTERENFSGQQTPSLIDTDYRQCNFCQPAPVDGVGLKRGVRLFPGDDTPRTFIDCNLSNCEPPPGSTLTRCNTVIRESYVHTCTETVTIDGEPVELDHHSDYIYGKFDGDSGEYVYFDAPREVEVD